jgi:UDP-2-acetamido-3-amino-2,3-dideoxy-glucuronate N-acetyltransferase
VPAFALMAGVPARRLGWVGKAGEPLRHEGDFWVCPATGAKYIEDGNSLKESEENA